MEPILQTSNRKAENSDDISSPAPAISQAMERWGLILSLLNQPLRRHPKLTACAYALFGSVMLATPWLGGIIGKHVIAILFVIFSPILFVLLSLAREWNAEWMRSFKQFDGFISNRDYSNAAILAVNFLLKNESVIRTFGYLLLLQLVSIFLQTMVNAYLAGGITKILCLSALVSSLPAVLSLGVLWLNRQWLQSVRDTQATMYRLLLSLNSLISRRVTYIAAYSGFLTFVVLSVFTRDSVGEAVASWLHSCAQGANIASEHIRLHGLA